jgi:hypothetical protein
MSIDQESENNMWLKLAKSGAAGKFKDNRVFTGICKAFDMATQLRAQGKKLSGMRYTKDYRMFCTMMALYAPRSYRLFRAQLDGAAPTLRDME